MPIASPIGFLDVVNATLRASQVESTSRLTVANTAATKNFSVGDKFHIDKDSVDPVSVTGNVVASGIKISNLTISPTFDLGAVSNVGNTTANTLQFANATTGFVTTANVEIGGNITLTANAQVKVGSNVLAEYTGPHPRDPKEVPLKKYPEIAFDESKFDYNESTNTYIQAGYTVTADSQITECKAYKAFDNKFFVNGSDLNRWQTSNNGYYGSTADTTTGPVTTLADSTTKRGSYIQLESPHKIIVSRYVIWAQENSDTFRPKKVILLGSNTGGTDWVSIDPAGEVEPEFVSTDTFPASTMATVSFTNTTAYKYHRLVVRANNGGTVVLVQELELYGREEPSPVGDLSLDTTLKSTFNSVRSNNYVMYFDGEGFIPGDTNSNNLVDNSSTSVIHHNATYDSTGKYWTLDGSTESNVTTGSLGFEGDVPHTVSMWVNSSNLDANATTQQLFTIGSGYDKALVRVDDTQIAANTWHNVTYSYQGEDGSKVTYVDGRKVEEAQVEDTFGDYPPFAMTGYSQGGYVVSSSTDNYTSGDFKAWRAFNDVDTANEGWHGGTGNGNTLHYAANGGGSVYDPSLVPPGYSTSIGGIDGEWIKLEMPHKLVVDYVTLKSRGTTTASTQSPKDFRILGSNDDVNWDILESFTSVPYSLTGENHVVGATKGYKYIAMVVTRLQRTTLGDVVVGEISYYGHKEGDLTRFPEPTRVLKYPHIAMTGPGQRGHVIEASSYYDDGSTQYYPYHAFNNKITLSGNEPVEHVWTSATSTYPASGGTYVGTTYGIGTTYGEFLKLRLPYKIKPTKARIFPRTYIAGIGNSQAPAQFKIFGSNDNFATFTELYHQSTDWVNNGTWGDFTISTTDYFKHFGIVFTKTNGTNIVGIQALEYYGTQEDTGTPAIVGGPFAGKVANFRVYDTYLGEERIQEIYDAQKDAFGHKKSSMTFYKGRIGVGTTEPEGALTVLDEPHTLEKFPARAISSNDSYVEGQGRFYISSSIRGGGTNSDSGAYIPFGNSSSISIFQPSRNEHLSDDVDYGSWMKIESPQAMSLKKAEIGLDQTWFQIGATFGGGAANHQMGRCVALNKNGTRVAISHTFYADTLSNQGLVQVFDWNGTSWVQVGNNILGDAAQDRIGENDLDLDDEGNTLIVGSKQDGPGSVGGQVDVYYLNGANWTVKGSVFQGSTSTSELGSGVSISADGNTIAFSEMGYDNLSPVIADSGRVRVFTWNGSSWVQKGSDMIGAASEKIGATVNMTPDGNYIITSNPNVSSNHGKVWVYAWDGSAWQLRYSQTGTGNDYFGLDTSISDDGNVIAISEFVNDDYATDHGAVFIRRWNGTTYAAEKTLFAPYVLEDPAGDYFGSSCKLSGDGTRLIAGSRYVPGSGNDAKGRVFTFEYDGANWIRRGSTSTLDYGTEGNQGTTGTGSEATGHYNSLSISRDGSVIGVGMYRDDTFYSDGGAAKIFQMASNVKGIWGSNDDKNWTKITGDSKAVRVNEKVEFTNLDNSNYYKYHAIVYDNFSKVDYVNLHGIREKGSSTLHDGALTLTKNLDVPRIGPAFDADDTPRRDRLVVEYNTSTNPTFYGGVRDTSGRGNDGVLYGGASYNATDKALVFDGTNDYLEHDANFIDGIKTYTMSIWVNPDTVGDNWRGLIKMGDNSSGNSTGLYFAGSNNNGKIAFTTYGNNLISTTIPDAGSWIHICGTYDGGTRRLYLNGVQIATDTATINLTGTNKEFIIGASSPTTEFFDGKISSFKFYDCALTAQEVKTLYDMGRCDEGHHVVNFSKTRVGIGLGDGEAPLAMLDSRDTRLAFKYGGTTLENFEEFTQASAWTKAGSGTVAYYTNGSIHYQRVGNFCTATFDYSSFGVNGNAYFLAIPPERFRPNNPTSGSGPMWYGRATSNGNFETLWYYDSSNSATNGKKWIITASMNGSNFSGGNGTTFQQWKTTISYDI